MVQRESCPSEIGPINLGTKQTGALSAGNPHAGCDVAGAGNGFTVWLLRHSQRKRGAIARLDLRNTAPVLDPTPRVPVSRRGGPIRIPGHWPTFHYIRKALDPAVASWSKMSKGRPMSTFRIQEFAR